MKNQRYGTRALHTIRDCLFVVPERRSVSLLKFKQQKHERYLSLLLASSGLGFCYLPQSPSHHHRARKQIPATQGRFLCSFTCFSDKTFQIDVVLINDKHPEMTTTNKGNWHLVAASSKINKDSVATLLSRCQIAACRHGYLRGILCTIRTRVLV